MKFLRNLLIFGILTVTTICSVVHFSNISRKGATRKHSTVSSFAKLSLDDVPNIQVSSVNCSELFADNKHEITKAEHLQSSMQQIQKYEPETYITQTQNCSLFKVQRHYLASPVNTEEAEFTLAFSIMMYKDVHQFERLLRAIYRPQNIYCVHVDNKTSTMIKRAVVAITSCFDNVFISRDSYDVRWGTFTVLAPELSCMRELIHRDKKWKYFINLTGQEFPLKTNWQIVRILKAFNGSNNLEGTIRRCLLNIYQIYNVNFVSFVHFC
jgi:beta-1,3-galactosyl-O-glycosyl-glycoprotein beta-1,6-N-acetylglucosaminyltransferase